MKTITLVAYNRLDYLIRVIDSLKKNNYCGYQLFIGVEPEDSEVVSYCRSIDFLPVNLTVNESKLGVSANPLATLRRAFEAGSTFNVALEDDVILAPDAFDLANWYFSLDEAKFLCLNLIRYQGFRGEQQIYSSDVSDPTGMAESTYFTSIGWAIKKEKWDIVKSNWSLDKRGWDFSMNTFLESHPTYKVLQPRLARATHIGRERGQHCSQEYHDKTFGHIVLSAGNNIRYSLGSASTEDAGKFSPGPAINDGIPNHSKKLNL